MLVAFFLPSISAKSSLALAVWASPATCTGGVFLALTGALTNVHTHDFQPHFHSALELALVVFSSANQALTNVHTNK